MSERVVSQIKRKTDSGYDNFNIGPELKYVGALAGSGNNNLEEQLLLGGSRIVKTLEEKGFIFNDNLSDKELFGLTNFNGDCVLTDGDNIYYSCLDYDYEGEDEHFIHYILNQSTSTLSIKTLNGFTNFNGNHILTDGDNIYYSQSTDNYVLDKTTSTLSTKILNGDLTSTGFLGQNILTDGDNIYYSQGAMQYILDKETSTLIHKVLNINIQGKDILTDGENIYYSTYYSGQYILDKNTSTLLTKTLNSLTQFYGRDILTDGNNIYYSDGSKQYILDKSTSTLSIKTLTEYTSLHGDMILTDGDTFYYSTSVVSKVLDKENSSSFSKQVIEYRTENIDNNYYILEINDYGNKGHGGNIYVEDFRNTLYISNFLTADTTTQTAVQEEYNPIIYFDNGTLRATPDILIKEYNLKYQKGNGPIDVSKKEVYQVLETIDGDNVKVNKEIVTDLLLS